MTKQEGRPETTEKKDCSFEEGVEQIIELASSLLLAQDYVVVAISGPLSDDTNVGKTFLSNGLARGFAQRGISCIVTSDEVSLRNHASIKTDKGVIILGAMGSPSNHTKPETVARYRAGRDSGVQAATNSIGLPVSKVDIHVFIYRPDKPVCEGDRLYNDIIIKNENAIDDPDKL
ncbi:MAG: hypothetical protein WC518_02290 [Patescibacteria group bacterium]